MDALDIVRESSTLLSANLSLLFSITVILIFPVSSIILSQVLANGILAGKLARHFEDVARAGRLLENSFNRVFYLRLSQALISYAFCFPVFVTLWLLAKTAIVYTIHCNYVGKQASILGFLTAAPRIWKRLLATYLWICLMVLGFASAVILSPLFVVSVVDALEISPNFVLLLETPLVIIYSVVFAHMMIVFNLANVVSILEERCGAAALLKALFLIKGRTELPLLLFLLTTLGTAIVECLFQYRVLGNNSESNGIWLWEAPLLIFLYSFVYLFDTIMTFVFYYACKSDDWENGEMQYPLEHFAIALEMMDQCRKMYSA